MAPQNEPGDFMMLVEAELQAFAKLAREAGLNEDEYADVAQRFDALRARLKTMLAEGLTEDAKRAGLEELSRMRATVAEMKHKRS